METTNTHARRQGFRLTVSTRTLVPILDSDVAWQLERQRPTLQQGPGEPEDCALAIVVEGRRYVIAADGGAVGLMTLSEVRALATALLDQVQRLTPKRRPAA